MWSVIGPERRTETLQSSTLACQLRGKTVFSLKAADFISTKPACNLLQLSKQPCSTGTLGQLWKPTGLICVLPLTGPACVPFFEVYSCPRMMAPWVLEACPWPWILLVLFHSDAPSHQQSEDNMATSAAGLSEMTSSEGTGAREPGSAAER